MSTTQTADDVRSASARGGDVSPFHIWGVRVVFALMALFLLLTVAPQLGQEPPTMMTGAARALLAALGLLAVLGVRCPVQMLPLMLFELCWKLLWLGFIGAPLWLEKRLDAANLETFSSVTVGIPLVLIVLPYGYIFRNYVKRPGDPWGRAQRA